MARVMGICGGLVGPINENVEKVLVFFKPLWRANKVAVAIEPFWGEGGVPGERYREG